MKDASGLNRVRRNEDNEEQESTVERWELVDDVQTILEPVMEGLGLVFLVLLLFDYSGVLTHPRHGFWLSRSPAVIWASFLVDFVYRFQFTLSKTHFLSLHLPCLTGTPASRCGNINAGRESLNQTSDAPAETGLTVGTMETLRASIRPWLISRFGSLDSISCS